jgi:hypothetical protein
MKKIVLLSFCLIFISSAQAIIWDNGQEGFLRNLLDQVLKAPTSSAYQQLQGWLEEDCEGKMAPPQALGTNRAMQILQRVRADGHSMLSLRSALQRGMPMTLSAEQVARQGAGVRVRLAVRMTGRQAATAETAADTPLAQARAVAQQWLNGKTDPSDSQVVARLLEDGDTQLPARFLGSLSFPSTGIIEAPMWVGESGINLTTAGRLAQAIATLAQTERSLSDATMVLSLTEDRPLQLLAQKMGLVFAANGLRAYMVTAGQESQFPEGKNFLLKLSLIKAETGPNWITLEFPQGPRTAHLMAELDTTFRATTLENVALTP